MAEKRFIIEVRTKGFSRATRDFKEINKGGRQYEQTTNRLRKSTAGLERSFGSLRNRLLVGAFGFGIITKAAQLFFRSSIEFENVKTRLVGLTGSIDNAEKAFSKFSEVAATTPFQLEDVVNAGAQLKAFGAEALETIKPITDLAAFMGTTATEAANAFGRAFSAGSGAADILREKGILNIVRDFKGIEDITKLTLPQFRKAMLDAFTDPNLGIAGSADRLSETFSGAFSNMVDAVSRLTSELSGPLLGLATQAIQGTTGFLNSTLDVVKNLKATPGAFQVFGEGLDSFKKRVSDISDVQVLNEELARIKARIESASEPVQNLETQIVGLSAPVKETSNQFKIFANSTDEGFINLKEINKDVVLTQGVFGNLTEALDEQQQSQASTGVGVEKLAEQLQIVQDRLREVFHAQKAQITATNESRNAEEVRQARVAAGIELDKLREQQSSIFVNLFNQTEEGQRKNIQATIEMVEANRELFAQLGDVDAVLNKLKESQDNLNEEVEDSSSSNINAASSLNVLAGAMSALRGETKSASQIFGIFLRTVGSLVSLTPGGEVAGGALNLFSGLFAHTGGLITNRGIQRFANGGVVQGQDNVPIMAQAGEFVMRRDAVQNIGVQNLAQMNRTGNAGGITVNISGGVVDESYVNNELIPALNKASSLGNTLNA